MVIANFELRQLDQITHCPSTIESVLSGVSHYPCILRYRSEQKQVREAAAPEVKEESRQVKSKETAEAKESTVLAEGKGASL